MKIYYLQYVELGWDNIVSIATSPEKCIEDFTNGKIKLKTTEEINEYLRSNKYLRINYKILKE